MHAPPRAGRESRRGDALAFADISSIRVGSAIRAAHANRRCGGAAGVPPPRGDSAAGAGVTRGSLVALGRAWRRPPTRPRRAPTHPRPPSARSTRPRARARDDVRWHQEQCEQPSGGAHPSSPSGARARRALPHGARRTLLTTARARLAEGADAVQVDREALRDEAVQEGAEGRRPRPKEVPRARRDDRDEG